MKAQRGDAGTGADGQRAPGPDAANTAQPANATSPPA